MKPIQNFDKIKGLLIGPGLEFEITSVIDGVYGDGTPYTVILAEGDAKTDIVVQWAIDTVVIDQGHSNPSTFLIPRRALRCPGKFANWLLRRRIEAVG